MPRRDIDIKDFASRVERMCEFILDQIDKVENSPDQIFIQNLKKDAADIQFDPKLYGEISLRGLDNHIRGISHTDL